jgi:hypothetical protein
MSQYRQVEKELIWYFNHADAAIGFKSSHASFVAAVYGVSSQSNVNTDPFTDGMLKQIKKLRQIRNTLYALPVATRRLLEACYNLEYHFYYPPDITKIYGFKVGAVFFNSYIGDLEQLRKLCRKKIQSRLTQQEELMMFNIGEETRDNYNKAHQAYLDSRQAYLNARSAKR